MTITFSATNQKKNNKNKRKEGKRKSIICLEPGENERYDVVKSTERARQYRSSC